MATPAPTIKQLEALYYTDRLGSLQAAANHLCTTQSAIAKRVFELENQFNIQVFDRSGRKPRLTPQGENLLACAQDVLQATSRLLATMSSITAFQGKVKIGATELVSLTWLSDLVRGLRASHPEAAIEMEVNSGSQLLERLRDGQADVIFLPGTLYEREFVSIPVGATPFAWLASPDLGVPDAILSDEALADYPQLVYTPHGVSTPHINQQLAGPYGKNVLILNSISATIRLAIDAMGISFLPLDYLKSQIVAGLLTQIRTKSDPCDVRFYAAFRRDVKHPLAETIIQTAKTVCNFQSPQPLETTWLTDRYPVPSRA